MTNMKVTNSDIVDSIMTDSDQNTNLMTCVSQILRSTSGLVQTEELVKQIQQIYPYGVDIRNAVHQALEKSYQAVPVSPGNYKWLSHLLKENIIRHPLTDDEASRGFLLLDELEHAAFFPDFFQTHRSDDRVLTVELLGGPTIQAEAYIENKTWSLHLGDEFVDWIDLHGGQGNDDVLIMVDDALTGHYTLRLQPREARDNSAIQNQNIQLALLAEELVQDHCQHHNAMPTWDLAAQLIGRGIFKEMTPPDDLHCVLHQYSLLHFDSNAGYMLNTAQESNISEKRGNLLRSFAMNQSNGTLYDVPPIPNLEQEWPETTEHIAETTEMSDISDYYSLYLDGLYRLGLICEPLSFNDFRLLKAELDALINLEQEFGRLLAGQQERKQELTASLLFDSDISENNDIDLSDFPDLDDPPFWDR